MHLPLVYPGMAVMPIIPYHPPSTVMRASGRGSAVTVQWIEIPPCTRDEEGQTMQHYIVEVWRRKSGGARFEQVATNSSNGVFTDERGCSEPSHGRIFV